MNDTTKHTAGPWLVKIGINGILKVTAKSRQICRIWMDRREESCANARLIAASPRLLAALQAIVAGFDESFIRFSAIKNPEFQEDAITEARAAIAQALGTDGG